MLIFVRHGRTAANEARLLQGRLNQDLDALGERQAVAVAAMVAAMGPIDAVIASPLRRAQQTAAAFGLPVATDDRFQELAYGELEGIPLSDVPADLWQQWKQDIHFAPPGGETLAELDERVRSACRDLAPRAATQNIVVVSHVSPMKSAVAWALGVDIGISWNCHLDHAAVCRIELRGSSPILRSFNETAQVES